jgi:hypothetical protein
MPVDYRISRIARSRNPVVRVVSQERIIRAISASVGISRGRCPE